MKVLYCSPLADCTAGCTPYQVNPSHSSGRCHHRAHQQQCAACILMHDPVEDPLPPCLHPSIHPSPSTLPPTVALSVNPSMAVSTGFPDSDVPCKSLPVHLTQHRAPMANPHKLNLPFLHLAALTLHSSTLPAGHLQPPGASVASTINGLVWCCSLLPCPCPSHLL